MATYRRSVVPESKRLKQIRESNENWMNKKPRKPAYKYNRWWFEKHQEKKDPE